MSNKIMIPWLFVLMAWGVVCSCDNGNRPTFSAAERHSVDSIVKAEKRIQGLDHMYEKMRKNNDILGEIVVLREKGKLLRNESQFSAALRTHGDGLKLAEQANDTIEWVQALNNIGTDYRRMGILDMAQRYHYSAWMMAKEYSGMLFVAKKNRVVSLNGLANVYLSVNNINRADSVLRMALAGEAELGSLTGQAINYANLGSIFEQRGQTDSAWVCYRKSMELNLKDNNTLGMSLCHNYFGDLYRKARDYDRALDEYEKAYDLMKDSKDEWHALNSLIALANVWELKGDNGKAKGYLDHARRMAENIGSKEHLAGIYRIYYKLSKRQGDYRSALSYHELCGAMEDSLVNMDKVNRMQNTSLDLERNRQDRMMAEANNRLSHEQTARRTGYVVFVIVVLFLVGFIVMLYHARRVRVKSHRALKKLNDMREMFFTNITHEFRTPLTVILGLSRDLQRPETSPKEVPDVGKTIERQGQRMLRLINQLLDISKIKSKVGAPDWRNGNIVAYIAMTMETYTIYANQLGIKLQFIARDKNIQTDFVPGYISKIINNLLSNALKFTPKYGVVNVNLWQEENRVMLDVSDTGRGIPPENLPHIFDEFYQSDNVDGGIGTGVGLALVYQIVKSLEGSITVESKLNQGTTFHIVLPMRKGGLTPALEQDMDERAALEGLGDLQAKDSDTTPAGDAMGQEAAEAPRVLVIEDNSDIAAFIGRQLSGKYQVAYAYNGKEGLDKMHGWMPDLVITDLMMPAMDGLELCRKIRGDELICHIPIIVVTAKVSDADRIEGLKAGADAYLAKPFNSEELKMRVAKLLEQRSLLKAKFAKTMNFENIQETAQEDSILELDRRFLNKVTDYVYIMLNGRKNVDVETLASQMCLSYGQLNRKLSALTGYTPAQYIQRVKIKKAQRLLTAHPELGFNDVAEQCGFSDYSNFVRAFRNVLKQTPTQFVRNIK